MADYRLSNDAIQAQSRNPAARAVALYRGLLSYAKTRLTKAAYRTLLSRMDSAGLPLPGNLERIRAIHDFRRVRALWDLIYSLAEAVDGTTIGNFHLELESIGVTGDVTVAGVLSQQDSAFSHFVGNGGQMNGNAAVQTAAVDSVRSEGQWSATSFRLLGEPVEAGGLLLRGRLQAPYARMTGTYSRLGKLRDDGALYADQQDQLWYSKTHALNDRRNVGVGGPNWDSGWFGTYAHIYGVWSSTPWRIAAPLPNGFKVPVAAPGDEGGVVDAEILIRGLAVWPDGYFASPPHTFMDGTPGHPWYSRAPRWSDRGSNLTAGATIAIEDDGNVLIVLSSGSTWASRELDIYAELRVLLWTRGGV